MNKDSLIDHVLTVLSILLGFPAAYLFLQAFFSKYSPFGGLVLLGIIFILLFLFVFSFGELLDRFSFFKGSNMDEYNYRRTAKIAIVAISLASLGLLLDLPVSIGVLNIVVVVGLFVWYVHRLWIMELVRDGLYYKYRRRKGGGE